jgi:fructokinase
MKNLKKAKAKASASPVNKTLAGAAPAVPVAPKKTNGATMAAKKHTIIGLGELLWDVFPHRKELGGAPANFAYMTSLLGDEGVVASRVGRDRLGNSAARRLAKLGLSQEVLQLDTAHPTGTVQVTLADDGQPKFEIAEEVAWDHLEWTPQWQNLASRAAAVCFGSLAQRAPNSRKTIHEFLRALPPNALKVFDVNLRQEFFNVEILRESAELADIMKVNHEELLHVALLLGYKTDSKDAPAKWLLKNCHLKLVCVTEGPHGSFLMAADGLHKHPGFPTEVVDTVGAGDAFTAALVHHYLRGASLDEMNDAANRMGSWVASQAGATPKPNVTFLKTVRHRNAQPLD